MHDLDNSGRRLLAVLVNHIARPEVVPGNPVTYLTYQDAHKRLGLTCDAAGQHRYGQCLKRNGLDSLAGWAKNADMPAITGLIVAKDNREPGEGYFALHSQADGRYDWWKDQIWRAKANPDQWAPFLPTAVQKTAAAPTQVVAPPLSPGVAMPPAPLPTVINYVYDMVQAAGVNVDDWAVGADGLPIQNPRNNPNRNTAWSFVGKPGEPVALCIWHDMIDWTQTPALMVGNESKFQQELLDTLAKTNDGSKKGRLRRWLNRSRAFHHTVFEAFQRQRPVRVILIAGNRVSPEDPVEEHAGVTGRELDPVVWYVQECNGVTGAYTIARGVAPPKPVTPETYDANDPLLQPALIDLVGTLDDTEIQALIKARTRQSQFRQGLLERWKSCSVTGCGFKDALIASHIKPWSRCTTYDERVGVANGLLLTPNLDKLFDAGLISFQDNLRIIISPLLPTGWQGQLGIDGQMRIRSGHTDMLPFLAWHREHVYVVSEEQRLARRSKANLPTEGS